jgi:hypothetical protein
MARTRYVVDENLVAIHDTLTNKYAPYLTVTTAKDHADRLNNGTKYHSELGWADGNDPTVMEALKATA